MTAGGLRAVTLAVVTIWALIAAMTTWSMVSSTHDRGHEQWRAAHGGRPVETGNSSDRVCVSTDGRVVTW